MASVLELQPSDVSLAGGVYRIFARCLKNEYSGPRIVRVGCNCDHFQGEKYCLQHGSGGLPQLPIERSRLVYITDMLRTTPHGVRRTLALAVSALIAAGVFEKNLKVINAHFLWSEKSGMFKDYSKDLECFLGVEFPPIWGLPEILRK